MTKSARILALHKKGKTTRQIAEAVMGLTDDTSREDYQAKMAYVRVVTRQRKGAGNSPAQIKYMTGKWGGESYAEALRNRYRGDPKYRRYHSIKTKAYRARMRAEACA